jgi:predicted amidohydrolase YtcJ
VLFTNAKVYTPQGWRISLAVRDGRIVAIGRISRNLQNGRFRGA